MKKHNILVIGDLHFPFEHKKALEFCKSVYKSHDIHEVVQIGDILDMHFSSYHQADPDGHGAGKELELAKKSIAEWEKAFPVMTITTGNHDAMAERKMMTGGLSKEWFRGYNEVLGVKDWKFQPFYETGNWHFSHGMGQMVHTRAKDLGMHCVAGHVHSKMEARNYDGLWSVFTGCLIDDKEYAFAYGKYGKKSKIGCVVIEDAHSINPTVKMISLK